LIERLLDYVIDVTCPECVSAAEACEMASKERKYLLRTVDGEEYGPVDQECLVRWAQAGRITPVCQVRSTLIAKWEKARNISFLRDIVMAQEEEQKVKKMSLLGKVNHRMTMRATETIERSGLHKTKEADYDRAPVAFRALAGIVDGIIVVLYLTVVFTIAAMLMNQGVFGPPETGQPTAFILGIAVGYIGTVMYYVWTICFHAQTPGQRFWGIMLMRKGGGEFYLGRAFVFTIGMFCFGLLTTAWTFIFPSNQSLQELLSGTRMVRIKLVGKRR
jgi:uncharacterized RDD family membrane protein YckC